MTTVGSETRTKRANEALGVNVKDIIVDSRINKVLEMRTDTVAMLEALDAISEFYVSNTVEARRALRQDLELQNITLAKKFLSEYDQVCDRFEHVVSMSQQLDSTCAAVNAKVSEADINMKAFMEKASELENKRNFFMEQSQAIGMFLSKFQLSSDEVDALYRAPICPQSQPSNANMKSSKNLFFDALQRLRLAYADCKAMVEKHCYSAGFELLEVLGKHQDRAYQRLFEWVKKQCDEIAESGEKHSEEIDTMLQTAVKYLRQLPVYYAQCQDLIISARRTQLVQKFVMALTQGGPNVGSVFRAIDLHASDSPRYVADMLAWMHQSIAGEEEFLESIFGNKQPTAATAPSTEQSPPSESPPSNSAAPLQGLTVPELLAACLQGLGRPLRVRLSQTLETRQTVDSLYLIVDLLGFYEVTFQKIVQVENAVHSTVRGSLLECTRLLSIALQKQGEALLTTPPSYPLDLSVCLATKECARQIRGCLAVQNQALSTIPSDVDAANAYHADVVINAIIQPLLQACRMGGQALPQSDMAVFMLNNVAVLQRVIVPTSTPPSWATNLETESQAWITALVQEESYKTLHRSDLDRLLEMWGSMPHGVRVSEQPGLDQDYVATVMRAFYSSLLSTLAPQFERLHDPTVRERVRKCTAEKVADAHSTAHSLISNTSNGYDPSVLVHSDEEIRGLLGCA